MNHSEAAIAGRVSVIICVYQGERFILTAVRSALAQTYPDIEVIVVDDGSTDATAGRLTEITDHRLHVLQQPNAGLPAARNLALARASGEYVAFLDADDRWLPDKLEIEVRTLRSAPNPVGVAYSWYYAVDDDGRLLHRSRPSAYAGDVFDVMLRTEDFILPSASLVHRRVFEEIGGFDVGSYHEDRVFFVRAARSFPVWPTRRYLTVYRQSIEGKGRRILTDFTRARHESLGIVESLRPYLSNDEAAVLRDQQLRSLYFRFLMYGFDRSAGLMLADIDVASLRHGGAKGLFALLFAKCGLNLMCPLRQIMQRANRITGRRRARELLRI